MASVPGERNRRRWATAEVRPEIARGGPATGRIVKPGAGRPGMEQDQPGIIAAVVALVDPPTRGDPTWPLRWT